jgi:hypothetical protein
MESIPGYRAWSVPSLPDHVKGGKGSVDKGTPRLGAANRPDMFRTRQQENRAEIVNAAKYPYK